MREEEPAESVGGLEEKALAIDPLELRTERIVTDDEVGSEMLVLQILQETWRVVLATQLQEVTPERGLGSFVLEGHGV